MITVLFHMTVKAENDGRVDAVAKELTASTKAEDRGCIEYRFYRRADQPRELVLFEQWADAESLNAHIARLQRVYGPPDDGEPHPPTHHRRRLPKAFLVLFERTEAIRYEPIG